MQMSRAYQKHGIETNIVSYCKKITYKAYKYRPGHPNLYYPNTQCGNFMIFLSLRFYVKSILRIPEVRNLPFKHI